MNEGRGLSEAEQPREESKMKKYTRFAVIVFSLLLFAAIIVGAIVKKFGA